MAELLVITEDLIPERIHGYSAGYALRRLSRQEIVSIEDWLFENGEDRHISGSPSALLFPDCPHAAGDFVGQCVTIAEFSVSLLISTRPPTFSTAAISSDGACVWAGRLPTCGSESSELQFLPGITGLTAAHWLRVCAGAHRNAKRHLDVTFSRYVRSRREQNAADALIDLCISLESLLDAEMEISFRFALSLAKITNDKGAKAQEHADLLKGLYGYRSRAVHGDPKAERHFQKTQQRLPELHNLARHILVAHVIYMQDHSRDEWKKHIEERLYD